MPTTTYDCCTHIPIPTRSRKNKDTHPQLTPPLPHPTHSAFPLFTIMYNKYIWDSRELFRSHGHRAEGSVPSSRASRAAPRWHSAHEQHRARGTDGFRDGLFLRTWDPRDQQSWSVPEILVRDETPVEALNHPKHSTEHQ